MANTTFSGPVRSENGFKTIVKNSTTGGLTNEMTLSTYTATIDIAASGTAHKEAAIGIPSNFIPMGVAITVVTAAANNVNLVDIGTDADPDGFVDGLPTMAINAAGFKGFYGCNGVLGMSGFAAGQVATETADEVEVTISGSAGAGGQLSLKFFGIASDSPTA
tara:strand:- start:5 stop:493 length:489 start_codon:yes stop_codon:yes gene_type:complete